MEIKPEVTLVIFTHDTYLNILPAVLEGTKNIEDTIVGRYIVSPNKIEIPGYTNLNDDYLWSLFDPNFKYKKLYDRNWYRQQILKMTLDQVEGITDNILILDGDVVITKPMRFIENGKINYYLVSEYDRAFFNFNQRLIGLKKVIPYSFIAEAMIFNSEVMESLRCYIRDYNKGKEWIATIEHNLSNSLSKSATFCTTEVLSEYELYGSYVAEWYSDIVNKYIPPHEGHDFHSRIDIYGWRDKSPSELYDMVAKKSPHYMQAVIFK